VVLGARSEILDVGRMKRLVNDAIRKALNLRDQTCTTLGCTMPAEFCEAHHIVPWSQGGKTSLKDCKLLCPFHHHRAHDSGWITHHQPNGKTGFTRRT
jgi:5-methylcytosine-specific restriction endonuclease McrA